MGKMYVEGIKHLTKKEIKEIYPNMIPPYIKTKSWKCKLGFHKWVPIDKSVSHITITYKQCNCCGRIKEYDRRIYD